MRLWGYLTETYFLATETENRFTQKIWFVTNIIFSWG